MEVVVESHERAVSELERVQVVVLDVVRHEAAGQGVDRLVARRRQPLPVRAQLLARVDRGQRRRDPPRLERVRRVRAGPDGLEPELPPRLEDRLADVVVRLVRAPQLEARRAGHAVAQRSHLLPADVHRAHPEELHVLDRATVDLLEDLPRVRALHLEPPELPGHGLAHRPHRRAVVLLDLDVVAARLRLELQPVRCRGAADEHERVLGEVEQDAVPDDLPGGRGRDVLLRHVDREALDAVDRRVRDQLQGVGAFEEEVDHVVRLVVEHRGLAPGALLAAPVRELGRHDGVHVGADLRVAQKLDRVGPVEDLLQVLRCHPVLLGLVGHCEVSTSGVA